jgi:hypothetical protein
MSGVGLFIKHTPQGPQLLLYCLTLLPDHVTLITQSEHNLSTKETCMLSV